MLLRPDTPAASRPAFTATEKRQLLLYALIAFGLPALLALPLGLTQRAGYPVDVFPNAQMYYPAAGVMLALLVTRRDGAPLPRRFYGFFLALAAVMAGCALASALLPALPWATAIQFVIIAGSILAWIFLLTEKKPTRAAAGLCWGWKSPGVTRRSFAMIGLFLALYLGRFAFSAAVSGEWPSYRAYFGGAAPYLIFVSLLPSFFLAFTAFFGEEYGWRYFLQPLLQRRFGAVRGTLLLGVAWGLWHLPLDLFFYSPATSLQSIAAHQITCITLGVFFAFAYLKTGNIWVPVILHYLNNNMIAVLSGSADIGNQVYGWAEIGAAALINGVIFLPFLASRVFRPGAAEAPGRNTRPRRPPMPRGQRTPPLCQGTTPGKIPASAPGRPPFFGGGPGALALMPPCRLARAHRRIR